jgi:hypothetical protein
MSFASSPLSTFCHPQTLFAFCRNAKAGFGKPHLKNKTLHCSAEETQSIALYSVDQQLLSADVSFEI